MLAIINPLVVKHKQFSVQRNRRFASLKIRNVLKEIILNFLTSEIKLV